MKTELKINYCFFVRQFFDVRTELPADGLAALHGVEVIKSFRQILLGELRSFPGPKIAILQRPKITDVNQWFGMMSLLRRSDCLPVYDVDDHPSLLEAIGMKNENRLLLAKSVPAIQTSTGKLKNFYSQLNPHVTVFQNCCHQIGLFPAKREGRKKVFFGAFNRGGYSSEIARRISPVLERFDAEAHVVSDREFFDGLSTIAKVFENALEYPLYLERMRACDILLTPLQGLPGEEYKSDVKYIEASAQGVATIASRLVYGETITDGHNGLLADHVDDWPDKLEALLSSEEKRRAIAFNAWDYVRRERLFSMHIPLLAKWYLELWDKRALLWDAVDERLPEFRDFHQGQVAKK